MCRTLIYMLTAQNVNSGKSPAQPMLANPWLNSCQAAVRKPSYDARRCRAGKGILMALPLFQITNLMTSLP